MACHEIADLQADIASLRAQLKISEHRQHALAYAITGGEDAPGLLDSLSTEDLCGMVRCERSAAQIMSAISDTPAPLSNAAATLLHELNSNPIADKGAQLAVNTWLTKLAMGDV